MQDHADETDSIDQNIKLIETLLGESIGGIYDKRDWNGWTKFEIVSKDKKSFLLISSEYLEDRTEPQIRGDFRAWNVTGVLLANPGQCFQLLRSGLLPESRAGIRDEA